MSGINRPRQKTQCNPRQANKRLSQQNLPTGDMKEATNYGGPALAVHRFFAQL
jgi:hypothetical protein